MDPGPPVAAGFRGVEWAYTFQAARAGRLIAQLPGCTNALPARPTLRRN